MASQKRTGRTCCAQYCSGRRKNRVRLKTSSLQILKESIRNIESDRFKYKDRSGPARTGLADILSRYAAYIRSTKTPKSAQTDIYYLRQMFGPICLALRNNSRKTRLRTMRRPSSPRKDRRSKLSPIKVACLEDITAAEVSNFITTQVRDRGLKPKTANRFREILHRLINWAMEEQGIKMPGNINPVSKVTRYRLSAPQIRFLDLDEIDKQLEVLQDNKLLQTMAAVFIYAGLRREEALWLTTSDVDFNSHRNGIVQVRAKTIKGQFWQPKTKVNRSVPISSALMEYLQDYTPVPTQEQWYFPSPMGRHYDPDNFSRDLRNANHNAGLQWNCLDFRHTFGSQMAMKGVSLYKISTLMGNSPGICRRHYAALMPDAMAESVEFHPNPPRKVSAEPRILSFRSFATDVFNRQLRIFLVV